MELQVVRLGTARILQRLGYEGNSINFFEGGDKLQTRYNLRNYNSLLSKATFGEDTCSAPYLEEVQKWLRDSHQIYINVESLLKDGHPVHSWDIMFMLPSYYLRVCKQNYLEHGDALRTAIDTALLEIAKKE